MIKKLSMLAAMLFTAAALSACASNLPSSGVSAPSHSMQPDYGA